MADQSPDERADAFTKIIGFVLRPLIRALISQGVTAVVLYPVIKRIYVEVAQEELIRAGEKPTDSRISVLSGIHRRDIRAFRQDDPDAALARRRKITLLTTVVGRWLADDTTTDDTGRPLPLSRSGGAEPSFESLVQSVSKDVRPRAVLDELVRQGLAQTDDAADMVTLDPAAIVGPADFDQKSHFFAENVGDHVAAAVDNLLSENPAFLERAVFYNRLSDSSVKMIEQAGRERALDLLSDLNRQAATLQEQDMDEDAGTHRFRFGVFFYREDEATPDADAQSTDKADSHDDD